MKKTTLLLLIMLVYQYGFSQCPPNLDFESGTFSHWDLFTGRVSVSGSNNVISLASVPGAVPNRHQIMSDPLAKDPFGNFPTVCPYGGGYSVKLGNSGTGAEAEGMSYSFVVPPMQDTFTFTFFYAVVFQDPQHPAEQQPRFFATAYDVATGDLIDCASYDFIATSGLPGFQVSSSGSAVLYKNWSPVSIQFVNLAGHTIRLEFKTADCTQGGHFGYAYVDVGTDCSNLLAAAPYCIGTNAVTLNAPYGFQHYTWYNHDYSQVIGNTQSVTLTPPPPIDAIFHVDLDPYVGYGCRDTAMAIVEPKPIPDTPVAASTRFYCQGAAATALTATASPGHGLLWYSSATGGTASATAPTPSTATTGLFDYYVSQKTLFGCESPRKKITVSVAPVPTASFTIDDARQCEGPNLFGFTSTSGNLFNPQYTWDFGDGNTVTSATPTASHSYVTPGNYTVKLTVLNQPSCSKTINHPVTLVPRPLANFGSPTVICQNQTSVSLTDLSSIPGNLGTVNQWWWEIGGAVSNQQTPAPFIASSPGDLPVRLVVTTAEGCKSDTLNRPLTIRYQPRASFNYSRPVCDNKAISFTNQSFIPGSPAGENVISWNWQLGPAGSSSLQHPVQQLASGAQPVSLIVQSNFGCRSISADSTLQVNRKPQTDIAITDSCVQVNITFSSSDQLNSTNAWTWVWPGNTYYTAQVNRSFRYAGDYPFTLYAQSVAGCIDTVYRPYTIYDNKAFAGNDTIAAMDQPVQLNALGGPDIQYTWSPATGLNDPTLENPVATLDRDQLYQLYAITDKGCISRSDILIKRYKGPDIYIPTAFTPNNDGTNDRFLVFPVGVRQFISLAIYNRYGQQVFYTTDYHRSWDGKIQGVDQTTNNFIVVVKAIDYLGRPMMKKENLILIR